MRGKGFKYIHAKLEPGITPAYAGKRKRSRLDRLPEQDHPRLCGEKLTSPMKKLEPRRITPAYAGKSL